MRVTRAVATLCAVVLLLSSGFVACVLPPTTHALAQATSCADARTAFLHDDMVAIADATRDYSFGTHDYDALLREVYRVNTGASSRAAASGRALIGAPNLEGIDEDDTRSIELAFSKASDRFVYSADVVSHLDDCYAVAHSAYVVLILIVALAAACLALLRGTRRVGQVLFDAGAVVFGLFVALGAWAAIDFDALFTVFHKVLFAQGNWTFAADSLLICALPTEFWMGMGAVWLVVSAIASILSMLVGRRLLASR